MENDNNNPSSGGSGQPQPNPYRARRPSASIISSTTPMFQAPPNPNIQPPPSSLVAHHSRQRHGHNVIQNNFGSGDIDDDVQPSSNQRGRNSASSSNNRPQSPLGSPDSTAYWGPSPSPVAHNSYRDPLTPGGMCVVSSSTSDDIPPSPFSPEDMGGNSNPGLPPPSPAPVIAGSSVSDRNSSQDINDFNQADHVPIVSRRRPLVATSSSTLNLSLSSPSNNLGRSSILNSQLQGENQDLNHSSTSSRNASPQVHSFNISPLRNKIKKASSFERFSLAQAAIISNAANSNSTTQNVTSEPSISSIPLTTANSSIGTNPNSVSVAGPSRAMWDASPPLTSQTHSTGSIPVSESTPTSSASLRSFSGHEKFHIKIPSKKLAAKLASVYEQEQLNEQLNALAAAEAISAVGSKRSSLTPSVISSGPTVHQSQNDSILNCPTSQNHTPPSTLAQILNQTPSNIHVNGMMTEESIIHQEVNHETLIRELSEAPLNLTESTGSNNHTQQNQQAIIMPPRNPVISSRGSLQSQSKKIPLTPKQKLLHRLQTGEFMASLSPSPPTSLSQPVQQQQSLPVQTIQQQSVSAPVVTLHQSLSMIPETLQQNCGNTSGGNHVIGNSSHSPPQQLDNYAYETLLRSRDDFAVQDSLGKVVGEDPNVVSNMLSSYDPDAYSYYYPGILGDEIFTGNNSSSSSRQLLMMPSGNLQDTIDQPQGHLEFVLGFGGAVDDHDNERNREDDLQLNNDGNPGSQQFMDPNDALSAIKSQSQADSTLRNLLMMEPIRNSHTTDDTTWLALAAAEYQNRINLDPISRTNRNNSLIGTVGSSVSVVNPMNNSWINEWPRTTSWQSHPSVSISGVQDQDEVMDMSMIEHVKGPIPNQIKRIQVQMQSANNDHAIEEIDLTNGLPILSSMSVNMPIDLQHPISILPHGNNSGKDSLPMDLQQHHRMEIDDEPVNLIAVNMEQDQDIVHHHHSSQSHSSHLNQSHQQLESSKGPIQHHQNNSYALQIQNHHSSQQDMSVSELNSGSNGSPPDNIDERRIIRAKKNKESVISNLNDVYQISEDKEFANIIMDRPIQPKSIASLPSPFRLARVSGNELAVFNNTDKNISAHCRLGPVEGPLKKANIDDISNVNAVYPCLVMADGCNVLWQLDRSDDEFCNWMKFVRLAHSVKDQNAVVVESEGYLYFMTCKDIPPNVELQVGYSYEYAQKYAFPFLLPMDGFMEQERMLKDTEAQKPNSAPPSPALQDDGNNGELVASRNEPVSRNVEIYCCFECDQEFPTAEELQGHLNTHKEPETIRKPKKKVMRRFLPEISLENSGESTKEQTGQNQLMSADSSMGAVETCNTSVHQESNNRPGEVGKAQDNSVSTGVGQPTAPPKVKCTMCYKSFATKERLEKHMIVHSDEDTKPLKCLFCPKRFLTNSALAGHVKTHAEEGKFFECPMCNFSTPQLLQLKEHVQTHKNRETGLFYCPKCTKKFSAYSMIRKHIRAFHGPRQFGCEQCPMSFPTSDKLKLHQLKHSDHREFLCAECGRQFKRKDKLREHTKRIHETKKKNIEINIPKDKNSKKFVPKVAPEDYQKFPFKCPDCMVGFKRRGMLVNHLAKKHPEKKIKSIPELNQPILRLTRNYPCLYCERVYKSSSKRKAHILKAHPGRPIPPQLRGTPTIPILNTENVNVTVGVSISDVRPSNHTGTIVQTVTDDGDQRHGIMNVSCTSKASGGTVSGSSNSENNLVSTTSVTNSGNRKEAIVGKVAASPHACQWCYREYATRAKLLQHQRKAHISLMPAEMQTPRTQKNNVSKSKKEKLSNLLSEAAATTIEISSIKTTGMPQNVIQSTRTAEHGMLVPDSTSTTSTTSTSTIQTVVADGINEGNVIGYLLTTTNGPSTVELGNLLQSEIAVMVPVQNISNTGPGLNVNLTSQTQSNPNIAIIASSNNSNSKNSNNM